MASLIANFRAKIDGVNYELRIIKRLCYNGIAMVIQSWFALAVLLLDDARGFASMNPKFASIRISAEISRLGRLSCFANSQTVFGCLRLMACSILSRYGDRLASRDKRQLKLVETTACASNSPSSILLSSAMTSRTKAASDWIFRFVLFTHRLIFSHPASGGFL